MASSGGKTPEGLSAGPPGERGADGNTIRTGEGAPSSSLGVNGDYYIDKASHVVYGPKTGGAWGSSTSLIGARGEQGLSGENGAKGATGATGLTGERGPIGPEGPRGLKGDVGEPGIQGERGLTGLTGEKGERGEKGEKGLEGAKGEIGSTGSTGATGPEGPRGLTGEAGPKGSTGATGPAATLEEWKAIPLETGISNKGSPYANAEYTKSSTGLVYLRGIVKNSGLLAINSTIATLPESYRPSKQQFIVTNLGGTIGNLFILTNGKIQISVGVGLETSMAFDGVFFPLV